MICGPQLSVEGWYDSASASSEEADAEPGPPLKRVCLANPIDGGLARVETLCKPCPDGGAYAPGPGHAMYCAHTVKPVGLAIVHAAQGTVVLVDHVLHVHDYIRRPCTACAMFCRYTVIPIGHVLHVHSDMHRPCTAVPRRLNGQMCTKRVGWEVQVPTPADHLMRAESLKEAQNWGFPWVMGDCCALCCTCLYPEAKHWKQIRPSRVSKPDGFLLRFEVSFSRRPYS